MSDNEFDILNSLRGMTKQERIQTTTAMLLISDMITENKLTKEEFELFLKDNNLETRNKILSYIQERLKVKSK